MKEYKRLTKKADVKLLDCEYTLAYLHIDAVQRLGELEDKIENGTLIELPCKVGDKAWYLVTQPTLYLSQYTIYSGVITRMYITKKDLHCAIQIRNDKGVTEIPIIINSKENLFFDKAEAEAKLKELKGK